MTSRKNDTSSKNTRSNQGGNSQADNSRDTQDTSTRNRNQQSQDRDLQGSASNQQSGSRSSQQGSSKQMQGAACDMAARCGMIPAGEDCRTGASISGAEAVELIRRSLKVLGVS
jgi:hypothetical protein